MSEEMKNEKVQETMEDFAAELEAPIKSMMRNAARHTWQTRLRMLKNGRK